MECKSALAKLFLPVVVTLTVAACSNDNNNNSPTPPISPPVEEEIISVDDSNADICDLLDAAKCLLPFPSNRFTI